MRSQEFYAGAEVDEEAAVEAFEEMEEAYAVGDVYALDGLPFWGESVRYESPEIRVVVVGWEEAQG